MALTAEALLEPVSEDAPAGEDLSYDSERSELELVFDSSVSVSASGDGADAAEVDWRTVLKQIEGQFGRTKDVWLAVYLCRAGARSGQLDVVEAGAQTLAGLFEQYWDTVHPTIDELGVPGRKGPCDSLAARAEFLIPLERAILFAHPRLGAWSGADLERFRAGGGAAEGYGMFRAALEELGDEPLKEALARVDSIEDGFRRADAAFMANAGGEPTPNFAPTYELLGKIRRGLSTFMTAAPAEAGGDDAEAYDGSASGGSRSGRGPSDGGGARLSGSVDSREDVIRALDAIADYYHRREPSSPVPLVLRRAKAWVTMDFMSVLKDISPNGIDDATTVLMRRDDDGSGGGGGDYGGDADTSESSGSDSGW